VIWIVLREVLLLVGVGILVACRRAALPAWTR